MQTFWFQAICGNHIVWDAVEVIEYKRKHTGNVTESLNEIKRIVEILVERRNVRQTGFANVVARAMQERVGDADETSKFLAKRGISRSLTSQAIQQLSNFGKPFTLWTLVDALTQLTQEVRYAGERTEADAKVSRLLSLAM